MILIGQAGGDTGVYQTRGQMVALTNKALLFPPLRAQAFLATRHCPKRDHVCKAFSIRAWVSRKLAYVNDPIGIELLHNPTLVAKAIHQGRQPYGDCDDFAMYTAALLKTVGLPATFVLVGMGPKFHHIYTKMGPYHLDATRDHFTELYPKPMREESFPV